jgi:hypothetical protein
MTEGHNEQRKPILVIPAEAGIQRNCLDAGLHRHDEGLALESLNLGNIFPVNLGLPLRNVCSPRESKALFMYMHIVAG